MYDKKMRRDQPPAMHTGAYQEMLNSYEKVNYLESATNLTFLSIGLVCRNAFIVRPCSEIVGVKG